MRRPSVEMRLRPLRLGLLGMARAHASEHGLSGRTAIKEVRAAAALLDLADLGTEKRPTARNPLIPAYKTRGQNGALLIEFRCPACQGIHCHGMPEPNAGPLQYRVSHCDLDVGQSRGYRLMVVGWRGDGELPSCSASEIDALNAAICESAR